MLMVKLSMVCGREVVDNHGEDDGVVEMRDATKPVVIDAGQVRNFYPRKGERVGTRILFHNGSALAVSEPLEIVEAAIREALS